MKIINHNNKNHFGGLIKWTVFLSSLVSCGTEETKFMNNDPSPIHKKEYSAQTQENMDNDEDKNEDNNQPIQSVQPVPPKKRRLNITPPDELLYIFKKAVRCNDLPIINQVLEHKEARNVLNQEVKRCKCGYDLYSIAMMRGNLKTVSLLLEHNIDNKFTIPSKTILFLALVYYPKFHSKQQFIDIVKKIIQSGVDMNGEEIMNSKFNEFMNTFSFYLDFEHTNEEIIELLLKYGADILKKEDPFFPDSPHPILYSKSEHFRLILETENIYKNEVFVINKLLKQIFNRTDYDIINMVIDGKDEWFDQVFPNPFIIREILEKIANGYYSAENKDLIGTICSSTYQMPSEILNELFSFLFYSDIKIELPHNLVTSILIGHKYSNGLLAQLYQYCLANNYIKNENIEEE